MGIGDYNGLVRHTTQDKAEGPPRKLGEVWADELRVLLRPELSGQGDSTERILAETREDRSDLK
jgi:hypothetical protein